MLEQLIDKISSGVSLESTQLGVPTEADLQIATGVILLEMAGADSDFAPEEIKACFRAMEKQFGISDSRSLEILESADKLRLTEGGLNTVVKLINENFATKQRQLILGMVWKIVFADSVVEKDEEIFARQLMQRLQLTEEEAEEAKKLAAQGRV